VPALQPRAPGHGLGVRGLRRARGHVREHRARPPPAARQVRPWGEAAGPRGVSYFVLLLVGGSA
jgi:hypothetical protein